MAWRDGSTFGHQLLCELVHTLHADPKWFQDEHDGFKWWPADFCQHVWVDDGVFRQSTTIYRVHAETEVIRGSGRALSFEVALEREMDHTTMSGLIYDAKEDTYKLHSSVFACEENMEFLKRTCFAAVILQIREAHTVAQHLQEQLNAVPAKSAHPISGFRPQPDAMLGAEEQFFIPQGQEPSRWLNAKEWRETEFAIERESSKFQSDHLTHLTAEFPWTATESEVGFTLDVNVREPHPVLGNGLHFTLSVPLLMSPERISHLAIQLNQYERDEWKRSHMMGSWCNHSGRLAFRMFVPNTVYRPELLPELTINMSIRAYWVNEYFCEKKREADAMRAASTHS